ncbi:MAG: hypothetical protein ACUZ8A_06425 [Candidatus Bathyanammoxibius sp.]
MMKTKKGGNTGLQLILAVAGLVVGLVGTVALMLLALLGAVSGWLMVGTFVVGSALLLRSWQLADRSEGIGGRR